MGCILCFLDAVYLEPQEYLSRRSYASITAVYGIGKTSVSKSEPL